MRKIYNIRCRQINVKCNFPALYTNKKCLAPHDGNALDQQKHIFNCSYFSTPNDTITVVYEDIFSNNVQKQIEVMKLFYKKLEIRMSYLTPDDPSRGRSRCRGSTLGIREAC